MKSIQPHARPPMPLHKSLICWLKNSVQIAFFACTFASASAYSADIDTSVQSAAPVIFNNREIADLHIADQQDRRDRAAGILTWDQVGARDSQRRALALQLHKDGLLRTKDDLESAALIFQHGDSAADYRLAFALATAAVAKSENPTEASWLMAASLDRWMLAMNRPQWYGTQYGRDASEKITLSPIEIGAVSSEERRRLRITLPEQFQ